MLLTYAFPWKGLSSPASEHHKECWKHIIYTLCYLHDDHAPFQVSSILGVTLILIEIFCHALVIESETWKYQDILAITCLMIID